MRARTLTHWASGILQVIGALAAAQADVLSLSNGRTLEGVIVEETDSHIEVQVTWRGYVSLEKVAIVSIARGDAQDHRRLRSHWQEEFLADQHRERERAAFEAAQRARGLTLYNGKWMTREEQVRIKEEQANQERLQREAAAKRAAEEEAQRTAQRLQALEEENRRLQYLATQPRFWWVPQDLIIRHHDHTNLLKDEQGNLIRVQEHDGHKFFTTTDGKHVDLQSHDSHLAFTDEQGIHHDLEPVKH